MSSMRELHLFAGIGGGVLGGMILGHTPVGLVERDDFCRRVLAHRFPGVPIHDDVTTYTGRLGAADVVAGGFPCQDISAAGKGRGLKGSRSGLWFEMLRVVSEVRPSFVFLENSPLLRTRGLGTILGGLAELGFDAEWAVRSAGGVGAPHLRKRLWLLGAHPDRAGQRLEQARDRAADGTLGARDYLDRLRASVSYAMCARPPVRQGQEGQWPFTAAAGSSWWAREPDVRRVVDGPASRVDKSLRVSRLKAIGNAQVPLVAATAFSELLSRFL